MLRAQAGVRKSELVCFGSKCDAALHPDDQITLMGDATWLDFLKVEKALPLRSGRSPELISFAARSHGTLLATRKKGGERRV